VAIHQSSNQYRILFFFQARDQIVLTHAFSKKTQQLKEKDIELGERRMEDWIGRFTTGGHDGSNVVTALYRNTQCLLLPPTTH
jgi:hypothetical protein